MINAGVNMHTVLFRQTLSSANTWMVRYMHLYFSHIAPIRNTTYLNLYVFFQVYTFLVPQNRCPNMVGILKNKHEFSIEDLG